MKEVSFVAQTKYQLLQILNYSFHMCTAQQKDLYISTDIKEWKEYVQIMKKENFFNNIYVYSRYSIDETTLTNKLLKFAKPKWYIKQLIFSEINLKAKRYDEIFVSSPEFFSRLLFWIFPKAQIKFIEDGTLTYVANETTNSSVHYKLLGRIFFRRMNFQPKEIYVNNSDICTNKYGCKIFSLKCRKQWSDEFIKKVYRIFQYESTEIYKKRRIVYLEQPNAGDNIIEYKAVVRKVLDQLHRFSDECIFKPHPRGYGIPNQIVADEKNNMWELTCMEELSEDHILVGNCSTAHFSPKIYADKEPYLVFTYKLFQEVYSKQFLEISRTLVNQIKKCYRHSEKVIVVDSYEDMIKVIGKLLNN